ncbi:MAG: hypothetical protein KIH69_002240 [Anaerolineae bacterium]|nr:hypothetical protein [Anaerolineae bacterium]
MKNAKKIDDQLFNCGGVADSMCPTHIPDPTAGESTASGKTCCRYRTQRRFAHWHRVKPARFDDGDSRPNWLQHGRLWRGRNANAFVAPT